MHFNRKEIIDFAQASLSEKPCHITDEASPLSPGTKHEFYSNGDYWWPNPDTSNGLPYVRRDGLSNPENFNAHRLLLRKMRTNISNLSAGYLVTRDEAYAELAVKMLYEFFIAEDTRMEPHLEYAQAIPGVCNGRGIGIIDTLHLTEIPFAIKALKDSKHMTNEVMQGLKTWFSRYLEWMNESKNGITERDEPNNHSVCWHVQALSFAGFVGNKKIIDECVERYKKIILPNQMREDGAFPDELGRTKPYSYSIFVLDNIINLVHLGTLYGNEDLWEYTADGGRSAKRGLDFLYPYLADKSSWFLPPDVEYFDVWPVKESFMLLAAIKYNDEKFLKLYDSLPHAPNVEEIHRNITVKMPILLVQQFGKT